MDNASLLKNQGYVLVPQVLSKEEVLKARAALIEIFSQKSPYDGDIINVPPYGNAYLDVFTRYPELRWVLFNKKMIHSLQALLGDDFVFIPETAIHDSGFGGWHKDTTSQESRGETFQWQPDFRMVQVGIYLQDNGEFGGGLDVIPFSHKRRDRFANIKKASILEKVKNKLSQWNIIGDLNQPVTIESRAGDMIVFDLRLDHKATFPKTKPIPTEHRKLAIFMVCSANNRHAHNYIKYIKSRTDYKYLIDHQYPSELIDEAQKNQINLMDVNA